jgi:HAD superfamily hydrolase (TIGR01509 family)
MALGNQYDDTEECMTTLAAASALIFDMDGVLIDSEPLHKQAKVEAFRRFGIVLPDSVYDSYKGRPDATIVQEIVARNGGNDEQAQAVLQLKHRLFEAREHEMLQVPGAVDFLHWAHLRYHLALATSATARNRAKILEMLRIGNCFEAVVDNSRLERPKPDPEVFQIAMHDLGMEPRVCWVIEDSINGIYAAKAAGCTSVGITTTFSSAELSAAGADLVIDSFAELREKLDTFSEELPPRS